MEYILNVYQLHYDVDIPLICMDEQPVQLLDDKTSPIPMETGRINKEDYEYIRKESVSVFLFTEPLKGWRHVQASEHRTKKDWALQVQKLLTVQYKYVKKIRLVMDNLNTHSISLFMKDLIRKQHLTWHNAWKYIIPQTWKLVKYS